MYEDEMMVIPDCSSVSQLQRIDEHVPYGQVLSSDDALLFLVSQKYQRPDGTNLTETGYISKCIRYAELSALMAESLSTYQILGELMQLSADVDDWKRFKKYRLSVVGDLKWNGHVPYVISSINLSNTLMNGLSGYPLSTGMDMEFSKHVFRNISANNLYATDYLYVNNRRLTYADLVRDYCLSSVKAVDGKLQFKFGQAPNPPPMLEVNLADVIDSAVYFREWDGWKNT